MHVVAEQRAVVGIDVEVELAARRAELVLDRLHDLMAVVDEGVVARPDVLDDLEAGVIFVATPAHAVADEARRIIAQLRGILTAGQGQCGVSVKSSSGIGSMTTFPIPRRRNASISSGPAANAPVKTT